MPERRFVPKPLQEAFDVASNAFQFLLPELIPPRRSTRRYFVFNFIGGPTQSFFR
jgi:hypothetical protein